MSQPDINKSSETSNDEQQLLQAKNIRKHFPVNSSFLDQILNREEYIHAVDGLSLSIKEQETLGLVGESGCGKSTLGLTLAMLQNPTSGSIHFKGTDISSKSGSELKELRNEIQFIFQDPQSSLNQRKTVGEIVEKPLEVQNIASGQEKSNRVQELFHEVGLKEELINRYPHTLSGGQQQRIGIARALAVEPSLIIADEPVSALDVSVQAQIINLMKRLQDDYNLSYLFIAHDLSVVKHVSDRVAVMYLGNIIEKGSTSSIFNYPQHPYTRALLNSIPSVEGDGTARENILEGAPPSQINPPSGCPFHGRCPEYLGEECELEQPELQSVSDATGTIQPPNLLETSRDTKDDQSSLNQSGHMAACHWLDNDPNERLQNAPFVEKE